MPVPGALAYAVEVPREGVLTLALGVPEAEPAPGAAVRFRVEAIARDGIVSELLHRIIAPAKRWQLKPKASKRRVAT